MQFILRYVFQACMWNIYAIYMQIVRTLWIRAWLY